MIFGITNAERRRRHQDGQPWFAWFPVELEDGRWAWWETVTRTRFFGWSYFSIEKPKGDA